MILNFYYFPPFISSLSRGVLFSYHFIFTLARKAPTCASRFSLLLSVAARRARCKP
ncbi:hypothetical protein PUN28_002536 [Cardiocondyla obscurior]|uniref:Uncharacterized protein n=1 Tax=Cardiocondyla obscurior TaxID=286306 RepID=A0AAW2GUM6_9HYME